MKLPILHMHLLDDPAQPPTLPGNRGVVVENVCAQAVGGRATLILPEFREALASAAEEMRRRLEDLAVTYHVPNRHTEWDELDIFVFQTDTAMLS